MGVATLLWSVRLGKDVYKAVTKKPPLFKIGIHSITDATQHKLLDKVEQFVKHATLVKLKNGASFAANRVMTTLKWIAILGVVGVIGVLFGKIIYRGIQFISDINKRFKIFQEIPDIFNEFEKCHSNIFLFLMENWSKNLNIKDKLKQVWDYTLEKLPELWEGICKDAGDWWDWLSDGILNLFDTFYNSKGELDGPEKLDMSNKKVVSPYDPQKMLPLEDKEWKTSEINNPNQSEFEGEEFDIEKAETPPSQKEPTKSELRSINDVKNMIKRPLVDMGMLEDYNNTLGSAPSEKDIENAKKEEQKEQLKNVTNNDVVANTKKISSYSISQVVKFRFDTNPLQKLSQYLTSLESDVKVLFDNDTKTILTFKKFLESY